MNIVHDSTADKTGKRKLPENNPARIARARDYEADTVAIYHYWTRGFYMLPFLKGTQYLDVAPCANMYIVMYKEI